MQKLPRNISLWGTKGKSLAEEPTPRYQALIFNTQRDKEILGDSSTRHKSPNFLECRFFSKKQKQKQPQKG